MTLKREALSAWKQIIHDKPGERFQHLYERRKQRKPVAPHESWILTGAAIITVIVGIVLMPAPGPGTMIVAVGLALLAVQFKSVAQFLDRCELGVRNWWR